MISSHLIFMPCNDSHRPGWLQSGVIISAPLSAQDAVKKFVSSKKRLAHYNLEFIYSVGREEEEEHKWEFNHHEIYQPENSELPALIVLRYKPCNQNH